MELQGPQLMAFGMAVTATLYALIETYEWRSGRRCQINIVPVVFQNLM